MVGGLRHAASASGQAVSRAHAVMSREVPPRVVYELTERGQSFRSVLEAMAAWGDADLQLSGEAA